MARVGGCHVVAAVRCRTEKIERMSIGLSFLIEILCYCMKRRLLDGWWWLSFRGGGAR